MDSSVMFGRRLISYGTVRMFLATCLLAFYDGLIRHIMTFEVGKVLEDSKWQAPAYCFKEIEKLGKKTLQEKRKMTHFPLHETRFRGDK
ncbi:hypothetical protein HAX54_003553 [Datura stramonium]|uniref:Uncharacterized protein n=1 Tax=Datura stramonium TaxID=4076 RepID=A0ABS8T5I4_DATST|nr:hypothetical protein [Datura stramonium]